MLAFKQTPRYFCDMLALSLSGTYLEVISLVHTDFCEG